MAKIIQQLAREEAEHHGLQFLLDEVAEYIADHPHLWIGGDGQGGHVVAYLMDACESRGLDVHA